MFALLVSKSTRSAARSPSSTFLAQVRWATKKAGGSTKNGRDSNPKFLGVKRFGNEKVTAGSIIVRQRGQKYRACPKGTTFMGRDHTIHAKSDGFVRFDKDHRKRQVVSILSEAL
jgi:large subunit ribosomal protein L27